MTYGIAVSGQSCIKYDRNCKLAADSIDFVEVVFHMPSKWAGLECVAQFVQNGKCYNKALVDGKCKLPNEMQAGEFSVSVFGYEAGQAVRGTTIPLVDIIEESGFHSDGATPVPPTPDLYAQLVGQVKEAAQSAYPKGGNKGQALVKLSDRDKDYGWVYLQPGGGTGGGYNIGSGLKLDVESNTLSVDVANDAEEDNTRPITSAAVYTIAGNIEVLLGTI